MENSKIFIGKRICFCCCFLLLLVAVFVRYVIGISFSQWILLAIFSIMVLLGERDEIILSALCVIPMYTCFNYVWAIAICIGVYTLKYVLQMRAQLSFVWILLIWMWEFLHCFKGDYSIQNGIKFLFPYIFIILLYGSNLSKIKYSFIVRMLAFCTIFMCIVTLSIQLKNSNFNFWEAWQRMGRLGQHSGNLASSGAYFNPNMLGFLCVFSSVGLLQMMSIKKGQLRDIVMGVVLLIFGTMTLSRTFLLCCALMFLCLIYASKRRFQSTMTAVAWIGVIVVILLNIFPTVIADVMDRWLVKDISSGRAELFLQYSELLLDSPRIFFFGTGLENYFSAVESILGPYYVNVSHNGIQEILLIWGFPGLVMFIIFIIMMIKNSRKINLHQSVLNYIPLVLLLFKVQFGQLITSYYTIIMFIMSYVCLCYDFSVHKEPVIGERSVT